MGEEAMAAATTRWQNWRLDGLAMLAQCMGLEASRPRKCRPPHPAPPPPRRPGQPWPRHPRGRRQRRQPSGAGRRASRLDVRLQQGRMYIGVP